jgi:hypothetical protein
MVEKTIDAAVNNQMIYKNTHENNRISLIFCVKKYVIGDKIIDGNIPHKIIELTSSKSNKSG